MRTKKYNHATDKSNDADKRWVGKVDDEDTTFDVVESNRDSTHLKSDYLRLEKSAVI